MRSFIPLFLLVVFVFCLCSLPTALLLSPSPSHPLPSTLTALVSKTSYDRSLNTTVTPFSSFSLSLSPSSFSPCPPPLISSLPCTSSPLLPCISPSCYLPCPSIEYAHTTYIGVDRIVWIGSVMGIVGMIWTMGGGVGREEKGSESHNGNYGNGNGNGVGNYGSRRRSSNRSGSLARGTAFPLLFHFLISLFLLSTLILIHCIITSVMLPSDSPSVSLSCTPFPPISTLSNSVGSGSGSSSNVSKNSNSTFIPLDFPPYPINTNYHHLPILPTFPTIYCILFGISLTFVTLSSSIWWSLIALKILIKSNASYAYTQALHALPSWCSIPLTNLLTRHLPTVYLLLGYGIPIISVVLSVSFKLIGGNGAITWCSIEGYVSSKYDDMDNSANIPYSNMALYVYYYPMLVFLVIGSVSMIGMIVKMGKKRMRDNGNNGSGGIGSNGSRSIIRNNNGPSSSSGTGSSTHHHHGNHGVSSSLLRLRALLYLLIFFFLYSFLIAYRLYLQYNATAFQQSAQDWITCLFTVYYTYIATMGSGGNKSVNTINGIIQSTLDSQCGTSPSITPSVPMFYIIHFLLASGGIFTFILYGINKKAYRKWKKRGKQWRRICCRIGKNDGNGTSNTNGVPYDHEESLSDSENEHRHRLATTAPSSSPSTPRRIPNRFTHMLNSPNHRWSPPSPLLKVKSSPFGDHLHPLFSPLSSPNTLSPFPSPFSSLQTARVKSSSQCDFHPLKWIEIMEVKEAMGRGKGNEMGEKKGYLGGNVLIERDEKFGPHDENIHSHHIPAIPSSPPPPLPFSSLPSPLPSLPSISSLISLGRQLRRTRRMSDGMIECWPRDIQMQRMREYLGKKKYYWMAGGEYRGKDKDMNKEKEIGSDESFDMEYKYNNNNNKNESSPQSPPSPPSPSPSPSPFTHPLRLPPPPLPLTHPSYQKSKLSSGSLSSFSSFSTVKEKRHRRDHSRPRVALHLHLLPPKNTPYAVERKGKECEQGTGKSNSISTVPPTHHLSINNTHPIYPHSPPSPAVPPPLPSRPPAVAFSAALRGGLWSPTGNSPPPPLPKKKKRTEEGEEERMNSGSGRESGFGREHYSM